MRRELGKKGEKRKRSETLHQQLSINWNLSRLGKQLLEIVGNF